MNDIRASIPVLRFSAGPLCLGIAAEDVVNVTPEVDESDVHIATLLGIEPKGGECRTIILQTLSDQPDVPPSCSFQADLPLDVITCEREQILPMPTGFPVQMWRPIIGFAEISQSIVLLLDIPSIVKKVLDTSRRRPT